MWYKYNILLQVKTLQISHLVISLRNCKTFHTCQWGSVMKLISNISWRRFWRANLHVWKSTLGKALLAGNMAGWLHNLIFGKMVKNLWKHIFELCDVKCTELWTLCVEGSFDVFFVSITSWLLCSKSTNYFCK